MKGMIHQKVVHNLFQLVSEPLQLFTQIFHIFSDIYSNIAIIYQATILLIFVYFTLSTSVGEQPIGITMRQYNNVEGMSGVQTWDVQQDTGSKATLLPTEQRARLTRDRLKWLKFWFLVTEKRYKINRQGLGETVCTLMLRFLQCLGTFHPQRTAHLLRCEFTTALPSHEGGQRLLVARPN